MNSTKQDKRSKKINAPVKDLDPSKNPKGGAVTLDGQKKEELAPIQMPNSTP